MQRYARFFNVFVFDESVQVRRCLIDYFRKNQEREISHLWTIKIHSVVNIKDLENRLKKFIPHRLFVRRDIEADKLAKIEEAISTAYKQGISVEIVRVNYSKVTEPEILVELAASI